MRLHKSIARTGKFSVAPDAGVAGDPLSELTGFGDNPGNLRGRRYVPDTLAPGAALVVVLHGCTQSAAGYDRGSGWSRLAERHGFALLYPEQQRANNANLCFNWFEPGDTARGRGEAASIAAMVAAMIAAHAIDPARVFVTGLSAGGAMSGVMLATHPELFAGGAIIAGLPFGCASGVAEALGCMSGRGGGDPATLGAKVRAAAPKPPRWPRISVWQGTADRTVVARNADAIVAQWAGVHGLPAAPDRSETVDGHSRRVWLDAKGEAVIEHYSIAGMGHGTPLLPGREPGQSGAAGAHMIDAGISSTDRIAAFFGIAPDVAGAAKPAIRAAVPPKTKPPARLPRHAPRATVEPPPAAPVSGIQKTIEDALRAAGLMR